MFELHDQLIEQILRNSSGSEELDRLGRALNLHPPLYLTDLTTDIMDLHYVLTEHHALFIVDSGYAYDLLSTMEAPLCKDLYVTIIDGIHTSAKWRIFKVHK